MSRAQLEPYILRADGMIHGADIRSVDVTPDGGILSAARDSTAQFALTPEKGNDTIISMGSFIGHMAFVNFVLYHPSIGLLDGSPGVVTGSNDNHVVLWNIESFSIEAVFDGHSHGVCCGTILADVPSEAKSALCWEGDIVTGDWGGVCIVFDQATGRAKQAYTKHSTAIRGIAQLPTTPFIVSCSGDKTIHQWNVITAETIQIYKGHEDVVQTICAIDKSRFATGSNDCSVRIWHIGNSLASCILLGHTSLVYSVAWNSYTCELVSASEDCTIRVWGTRAAEGVLGSEAGSSALAGELAQVIHHPCVVWCVLAQHGGDLIAGGADGVLRIWTRDDDAMASPDKLELLEQAVSSRLMDVRVVQDSIGTLDVASMPLVNELLMRKGQREGERAFARGESDGVEVYVWSCNRWQKVGTVVTGPTHQPYTGAALAPEKQYHNGRSYDYVFDVEVEGRKLKLPYNAGDSVLATAQNFIVDHAGIVAQDSAEEIMQFLLAHINPEDVSKIPGLECTGGHDNGRQQGGEPESSLAKSTPSTAASTLGTGVPWWDSAEAFKVFNAAGAQRKVDDLIGSDSAFTSIMSQVNTSSLPSHFSDASQGLVCLFHALPQHSRFPAIDAFRQLIARAVDQAPAWKGRGEGGSAVVTEVLAAVAPLCLGDDDRNCESTKLTDTEGLVTLRLAANAFAVLAEGLFPECDARIGADEGEKAEVRLICWFIEVLATQYTSSTNANIKNAVMVVLRNASVACGTGHRAVEKDVEERIALRILTIAARVLVLEPNGSNTTSGHLRTLATLFLSPATASAAWRETALLQGKKLLHFTLNAVASGAALEDRKVAQDLLRVFE